MPTNGPARMPLAELRSLARRQLGLLVGPGATSTDTAALDKVNTDLATAFEGSAQTSYPETAESLLSRGVALQSIRERISESVADSRPAAAVRELAKFRWTAVLSMALDDHLETQLVAVSQARPARQDVAVISDLRAVAPPNTLTVYKLLGSAKRGDCLANQADLLRAAASWATPVRAFADSVKEAPTLCLGFAGASWLLAYLLASIYTSERKYVEKLIVLADDPLLNEPRFRQQVPEQNLVVADGSLRDVVRCLEPSDRNLQLPLDYLREQKTLDCSPFADVVTLLDPSPDNAVSAHERATLLDYLFMPDAMRWDPYHHDLDFKRTLGPRLQDEILEGVQSQTARVTVLQGSAASGKTTLLKRVAFNLAREGLPVAWLRPYIYQDVEARLDTFFRAIADATGKQPLVMFVDDPRPNDRVSLAILRRLAKKRAQPVHFVVGVRSSDYQHLSGLGPYSPNCLDLPDALDEKEWFDLESYLRTIRIARDAEQAKALLNLGVDGRQTRDTLAVLYWHVPMTRQAITHSVRDEYLRLGNRRLVEDLVSSELQRAGALLQEAYSLVAVSCVYTSSLPVEVLVNALGIDYSEWTRMTPPDGSIWGLLYPEVGDDEATIGYRTRNQNVTDIIVEWLNGGRMSHHAEAALLQKLLGAGHRANPLYRNYARRVLVKNSKLERLSLQEGTEVFDAARRAVGPDRSILHHMGLFQRSKDAAPDKYISVYQSALAAPPSPVDEKSEPDEYIHTSIGAAFMDKIDKGELSIEAGTERALAELEKSRSPRFHNAFGVHAYARAVARLAAAQPNSKLVDRSDLEARALGEIDHYLALARSGTLSKRYDEDDMEALEEQKRKILEAWGTPEELVNRARLLWEKHGSQDGFAVATRAQFNQALAAGGAGHKYLATFEQWKEWQELVSADGQHGLQPNLAEAGLLLYYEWRMRPHRERTLPATSPIDWDLVLTCAESVLQSQRLREYPFYRYLAALALCHLQRWGEAFHLFHRNRQMQLPAERLHSPRGYLVADDCQPLRVQGTTREGHSQTFFNCENLKQDFRANRRETWGPGIHFGYIAFSFAGPFATRRGDLFH